MRPSLSFKTLFRTPFKTLFTFFLLALITFVLFSRVTEYSIINREIKNAAKAYRGVGSVEILPASDSYPEFPTYINADPRTLQNYPEDEQDYYLNKLHYKPLTKDNIISIQQLQYISSSSTRFMSAGVSDMYYRLDEGEGYYNYSARFIIEGTLSEIVYNKMEAQYTFNQLILNDCTLLAGALPWSIENKKVTIDAFADKMKPGHYSGFGRSRSVFSCDDSYNYYTEYIKTLNIGNRYVFVGRFDPLDDNVKFYLSDYLTNRWCKAIQPVQDHPDNYLETEQFAPLRQLIEITNSDSHTFDVVYTDDMSSIMRFAEGNMAITSGCELTKKDSLNKSNVCVVSKVFASNNNLNLGDKITLKLGTELFEQYKGLGAVAATRERYSPPEKTVELEIIGIYTDTDTKRDQLQKPHWGYSINTIFVPKSLLPVDESKLQNHVFSPSEFSFTIDNAWNIPLFIENMKKTAPKFEEMGLKIIFYDDGWFDIVDKYKMSMKMSLIAITALSLAVMAVTGFIVYLYIIRKKKEYAIMRALGTTKKDSAKALLLPLMASTIAAVLMGSLAASVYTINTVVRNDALAKIKDYAINTSIPIPVTVGCLLCEILLVLLFALFGLWRIGGIPPFMLLQDKPNKQARRNKLSIDDIKTTYSDIAPSGALYNSELETKLYSTNSSNIMKGSISGSTYSARKANTKRPFGHLMRYISRHIHRSAVKSILSILLSGLLLCAVGQFVVMRESYVDLCKSVVIKAKFINGLPFTAEKQIEKTGNVINSYYEYTRSVDFNYSQAHLVVTNNISRYTGEKTVVSYVKGYDETCMKDIGTICIVGSRLMEQNCFKPGDKVHITMAGTLKRIRDSYIDKYRKDHPEEVISDDKILMLYNKEIEKDIKKEGSFYTIVGTITTPSGKYDEEVFTPGTFNTTAIFGFEAPLELTEYQLANNLQANEFRNYGEMIARANSGDYLSKSLSFVMDTTKIDGLLKTLTLAEKLYPFVLAVAILIGSFIHGLIIILGAKDIAILRVLGTTRRRICAIFLLEHIVLCIIGLISGACGFLIYNGAATALTQISKELYLFTVLYFVGCLASSIICSLITTKRKAMDLLQTRE